MGIRSDSTIGLLVLAGVFAAFGAWRLTHDNRTGWWLIAASVLALAGAWWRIGQPPEPPEKG
jgi:hypothetical protein